MEAIKFKNVLIEPIVEDGYLVSLGQIKIHGVALRNVSNRFLPWFDTFEGDIFRKFRFEKVEQTDNRVVIHTTAISDPDVLFREQRDSSGDLVFREKGWDSKPIEAELRIVFEAVADDSIQDHTFSGFKYWFEYDHEDVGIHRFIDRQTWEIGGDVETQKVCLRNWQHPPVNELSEPSYFSTGGLVDMKHVAFPGNLWGRWILIPSFDFFYKPEGCFLAKFDHISNIRTLIESAKDEDSLRVLDMHVFDKTFHYRSNPKTILFAKENITPVSGANLWTEVFDSEKERYWEELGIEPEEDMKLVFHENKWVNFHFDTSYEYVMDVAEEFHAEYVFIDPVWQNEQSIQEELIEIAGGKENLPKEYHDYMFANMCQTLDWDVARIRGGEERLKALIERAKTKGLKIVTWLGGSMSTRVSYDIHRKFARPGQENPGIFATKESGSYAASDTGYLVAAPINFNTPYYDYMVDKVRGVVERTGLAGFLWDSYSNLGWWHVDYSSPGLEVQYQRAAEFYKILANDGMYLMPEAIVQFSNHSNLGVLGDYYFTPEEAAYGYQSGFYMNDKEQHAIIRGEMPADMFFLRLAQKHVSPVGFHHVPREEWDEDNAQQIKQLFKAYKENVQYMKKRTILDDFKAVRWDNDQNIQVLYVLEECSHEGPWENLFTGETESGNLSKNTVYRRTLV